MTEEEQDLEDLIRDLTCEVTVGSIGGIHRAKEPRKIIQIAMLGEEKCALCNDGTILIRGIGKWYPDNFEVPQPEDEVEKGPY